MKDGYAIEVKNVTIQFGELKADNDVCFSVKEGEFFGIIGPNGAGKTTIFNAMTGGVTPTEGNILFGGQSVLKKRPDQICHMGISRTYQNIRLFPGMSVQENIETGIHAVPRYSRLAAFLNLPIVKQKEKETKEKAWELMERLGLEQYHNMLAGNLPYGLQRKLEIARALATEPKYLLLDEPAAGMNPNETQELMDTIRFVRDHFDMTILLIEHDMKLVSGICEELTVLNFGQVLAQGKTADVLNDPAVITAYLGE